MRTGPWEIPLDPIGSLAAARDPAGMLPEGLRVYAVGDIHGRIDLLENLQLQICGDLAGVRPRRSFELFLGDYVDRGSRSREVVERLASSVPVADERICLMGNHEQMLLDALSDPSAVANWIMNGGTETMLSYGVDVHRAGASARSAQQAFRMALPQDHQRFIEHLPRMAVLGGYAFVHAGLRPGRALSRQAEEDLLWIREPFLSSNHHFAAVVVHGHTPVPEPEIRPNRINIDTGAVFTGTLTCIVLEGRERRFLQARS